MSAGTLNHIRIAISEMPPSANAMRAHFIDNGKARAL